MQHRTNAIIGTNCALTRCTCGWQSKTYPRSQASQARTDAADHIIASIEPELPGLEVVNRPKK